MTAVAKNKPNKRQVQERRERRKRGTIGVDARFKLSVDPALKDPNYVYCWMNDDGGNLEQMVADDWDPVTKSGYDVSDIPEDKRDDPHNSIITRPVGPGKTGQPINAVLCRKHRDWHEADLKEEQSELDAVEEQIKRGEIGGKVQEAYVPGTRDGQGAPAVRITRENR